MKYFAWRSCQCAKYIAITLTAFMSVPLLIFAVLIPPRADFMPEFLSLSCQIDQYLGIYAPRFRLKKKTSKINALVLVVDLTITK